MICSSLNLFFTSDLPSPGVDSKPKCYSKAGRRRPGQYYMAETVPKQAVVVFTESPPTIARQLALTFCVVHHEPQSALVLPGDRR
jgi:hypothetical protein